MRQSRRLRPSLMGHVNKPRRAAFARRVECARANGPRRQRCQRRRVRRQRRPDSASRIADRRRSRRRPLVPATVRAFGVGDRRRFPEPSQRRLSIVGRCRFGSLGSLPASSRSVRRSLDGRAVQRLASADEAVRSGEAQRPTASPHSICRRTSFGGSPESSADSSSRATASAGGQRNSARFAAAEYKSRCRSPVPAPSRMKSSVDLVQASAQPLPAARRAAFASPSLATRSTAACQSAAAASLVLRHGRHVERCRRLGKFHDNGQRPKQFVERQPALVQAGLRVPRVWSTESTNTIINARVNRHGGQFGEAFSANRRQTTMEVERRRRRPKPRWTSQRENPSSRKRTAAVRPGQCRSVPLRMRPSRRRPYGRTAIRRRQCPTTTTATSTAPAKPAVEPVSFKRAGGSLRRTGKRKGRLPCPRSAS